MAQSWKRWSWRFGLASSLAIGGAITSRNFAVAQIAHDNTLGAESSVITPNVDINGIPGNKIDGGATRGANLFHSFKQFSVPNGSAAYFNNASEIQNIIGRVTGLSGSNIDGLIQANGTANLFLINPKGIIFGPNAALNIGGSFVGTTADAIQFGDQVFFSASVPDAPPVLTVNPSAFFFSQVVAQPITVNSRRAVGAISKFKPLYEGLKVPGNQSLLLLGGDVSLDNGILQTPGGRVELGGLAGAGTVGLSHNGSNLRLSFPLEVQRADVSLTNGAEVDVIAGGGGSIAINARNLNILGGSNTTPGSKLLAGIGEGLGTVGSQAGDITLDVKEAITIGQSSSIFSSRIENRVNFNAIGNAGDINIQAGSLSMTDGARIITNNFGLEGNAGSIFVQAGDAVSLSDNSSIDSSSTGFAPKVGDSGDIQIKARSLSMEEGARLSVGNFRSRSGDDVNFGQGNAGNISVQVEDTIFLRDSLIESILGSYVIGKGGNIEIKARSLTMTDEGRLSTSLNGRGEGGSISIQVEGRVSLTTSTITSGVGFTDLDLRGEGSGGDIQIEAGSLLMPADAYISADTNGWGIGGSISVQAVDTVSLSSRSAISSSVNPRGEGDGGNIQIEAKSLFLADQARLNTNTSGLGDAGNISTQVEEVSLSNSSVDSDVDLIAEGNGGNIQIQAESLLLTNGAKLNSSTEGQGNAGDIEVNASDSANISGFDPALVPFSGLFTTTGERAIGQGGNISVTTGTLRISDRARLDAQTNNAFRGGNITVDANTVEITSSGKLLTTTFSSGEAGDITVNSTDSITISGSDPTFASRFADERVASVEDGPASGLFAQTQDAGDAGGLKLTTRKLTVQDGAQVSASTTGLGPGGILEVTTPTGSVEVIGSGSRLTTETQGAKEAGNLTITTGQLLVQDGAEVTVSGRSGPAGDLTVMAGSILLNQGKLTAVTGAGDGGNITLGVPDLPSDLLLMRNNSEVSAEALGTANGGNITINTDVLAALENSDIIANAFQGRGGQVEIAAEGLFRSPDSDITASSAQGPQFSGTVELNTPDVDPSSGLVALPEEVVDVSGLVSQRCPTGGSNTARGASEFVVTGRGGLPPSPSDPPNSDAVLADWVALSPEMEEKHSSRVPTPKLTNSLPAPLVEAQGWVRNSKSQVVLTAQAALATPHSSGLASAACPGS